MSNSWGESIGEAAGEKQGFGRDSISEAPSMACEISSSNAGPISAHNHE